MIQARKETKAYRNLVFGRLGRPGISLALDYSFPVSSDGTLIRGNILPPLADDLHFHTLIQQPPMKWFSATHVA